MSDEINHNNNKAFTSTKRRLILGILISICFVAVEATIGLVTGSLALISDAGHNAADTLAMGLSLFAVYMMAREPTERRTYGYGRVGILAALANSVGLVVIAGVLAYEAVVRIIHIRPVSGSAVLIVAAIGVSVNSLVALALYKHRKDLNIKSAFLHMVTDAGISLGVLVAGIIITLTNWYYADPIVALVISVFILRAAWGIIRDATDVLLESVPRHIDLLEVQKSVEEIEGVQAVHHLHIWELGSGVYAMSGHVEVEDRSLSECSGIMEKIREMLLIKFNIVHPTIQMECLTSSPG